MSRTIDKFWDKFTYAVMVEFYKDNGEITQKFVTKMGPGKTCEWKTIEEAKKEIICFDISRAVDLMNSLTCNGYNARILPWWND